MTESSSRVVQANRIISSALPPVHITVDPAFTYVGGPRFDLYGIAHAEQHLFVIADEQRMLRRFLWVQFEGFLPDNQRTYRYTVTQTVDLGGTAFIYDPFAAAIEPAIAERPDSDLAAVRNFLQAQGYQLPEEVQGQRFVHLIGTHKRDELMIIYGESSDAAGSMTGDAKERALSSFTVQFT